MSQASTLDPNALLTHRDFVRSVAGRLLADPADVDDVEQRTWLSVLGSVAEAPGELRAWLAGVARNHSLSLLRSRRNARAREQAVARSEATDGTQKVVDRVETARRLVAHVTALAEPNRSALLMRYYDDLSIREIAEQLDVSPQTVKGRVHRGLAELRMQLDTTERGEASKWRQEFAALVAVRVASKGVSVAPLVAGAASLAVVAATVALWPEPAEPGASAGTDRLGTLAALAPVTGAEASTGAAVAPEQEPSQRRAVAAAPAKVESGEVTLRIGEAFVFGEDGPRPDGERAQLDLYCQDIRKGISLACPQGSVEATPPHTSIGLPTSPPDAYALVSAAPLHLPNRDLWLLPSASPQRPGIGFVAARNGLTYKLCLLEIEAHPEALRRAVKIGYEAVPRTPNGGVIELPEVIGQPADGTLRAIQEAYERGQRVPGDSFAKSVLGDYANTAGLLPETTLTDNEHVVVSNSLQTHVDIASRGAVFAGAGIGANGRIRTSASSAIGCLGTMSGTIDVDAYTYIYIDGTLNGTVHVGSYATLYVTGGITGTIDVDSYAKLYVQGPVTGTIDAGGSCWCTFFFDGFHSAAELESFVSPEGDYDQITLHVRESDLPQGEYEDVGTWRKVIVGDDVWETLGN